MYLGCKKQTTYEYILMKRNKKKIGKIHNVEACNENGEYALE